MVRFFGRTTKTPAKKSAVQRAPDAAPPPPATKQTAAKEPAAPRKTATTPRRRTTTARPPRRDWAAEAADTPIGEPAPKPSSLATSPGEDEPGEAAKKRRRGTRGGRGRKKPGAASAAVDGAAPADLEPLADAAPLTIEGAIAHQAQVLDRFARDMTATIQRLQATIGDLQSKVDDRRSAPATSPRVGIFVDVPNLIYAAERRNVNLDFGRVLDFFTRDRELVRASAYAPITDDPQAKLENQRFVQHFVGHPYRIITKPLKRFADGSMKANFDIELAIDILTMSDRLDIVVLMSGDGDFRRLVELISSRGVRVEVAAWGESASAELKVVADRYVDFANHIDDFRARK